MTALTRLRSQDADRAAQSSAMNPAAERYVEYADSLLERAQASTDPEWTDTLNRMAGQMMEIAIYLGAKTH